MSIEQYPAANGVLTSLIWRKTAVGGETSLSGYDNATQALSYTPGQEQVYLNGILLVRGSDYTATNGTSITGLTALAADDFVQINCYNNFSVASVPTASLTGTVTNAQLANSSITINGSAVALGGSVSLAGDIESVTASTGLSGGGNTGALTLTNTMATAIDAKGDLVVGTGADAFAKLTVGANDTILTADSTTATGLKWAAAAGGGGMTLLETLTLTGSSVTSSTIPGTYKNLQVIVRNYKPSTDNQDLNYRFNEDSGTRYKQSVTMGQSQQSFNSSSLQLNNNADNSTAPNLSVINIYDYANADTWKFAFTNNITADGEVNTANVNCYNFWQVYNQTAPITKITFIQFTGNFAGTVLIYGVK